MSSKNLGGRPKKFKSPEELRSLFDTYLELCGKRTRSEWYTNKKGEKKEKVYSWPKPITISGFAVFCECHRATIWDYETHEGYSDTIKYIRATCEADRIDSALDGSQNYVMAKFDLINNHGYAERQEIIQHSDHDPLAEALQNLVDVIRGSQSKELGEGQKMIEEKTGE